MNKMKALVFHGVNDMRVETVPIPDPKADEVLIRVKACGICGTDPHILHGVYSGGFPLIPGHECAGEIVKIGSGVKKLKVGDRVTVDPNVSCGYCEFCQQGIVHMCKYQKPFGVFASGGFAEYAPIRETHAMVIPDHMSYEEGAMVEPLACCLRGSQMSHYKIGSSVLIHGMGAIGNMNMQLAKISGVSTIIVSDPVESRRKLALDLGADYAFDPTSVNLYEEVQKIVPDGPNVIMECAGKASIIEEAVEQVVRGGIIVAFGVCALDDYARISPAYLNDNEITISGSLNNPYTHYPGIQAIASGRIKVAPLISNRYSLDDAIEAFAAFGTVGTLKILITP